MPRVLAPKDWQAIDSERVIRGLKEAYDLTAFDQTPAVLSRVVVPSSDPLQGGHAIAEHRLHSESATVGVSTFERVVPPDMAEGSAFAVRVLEASWAVDYSNGNDVWRVDTTIHRGDRTLPLSQHQAQEDRRYTTSPDGDEYFPDRSVKGLTLYKGDELRFDVTNDATDVPIVFDLDILYVRVPLDTQLPT